MPVAISGFRQSPLTAISVRLPVIGSCWPLAAMAASIHSENMPIKFEDMCGTPAFASLLTALDEEASVPFRQILSHHTSTPCQPTKAAGPISSLKACGMDTKLRGATAGCWRLELALLHSFEFGDDLDITYIGPEHTNFKQCQAEAV